VIVAAVVIFGLVIGAILKNSGLRLGPKPAPALVSKVVSLSAAGTLSCPSAPVWSPNGKQLAVLAGVGPSLNGCWTYSDVTNIQQTSNGETSSGPAPDKFAIIIFDAASSHVVHTITLPAPSTSLLCAGADPCGVTNTTLESLGWSPDGRSIAVFGVYTYEDVTQTNKSNQTRGLLVVAPVDGAGAPRMLIAMGRDQADLPNSPSLRPTDFYSPPRFTWDLTAGSSTYSDIQRGQWPGTVPLADGYRLEANGALTIDQTAQAGDASPWRAGVFQVFTGQGLTQPYVIYRSSQWLWSTDSRYALPNVDLGMYLTIPGITATPPPDTTGMIPQPIIVPPDAALNQTLRAAVKANSNVGLARNPDGKLLAAWDCVPTGVGQLTIRNVTSGQTVAQANYTYPLTSTSLGCGGGLGPIAWSPDGAHIAATDGPDGQIIVWQVNVRG
jgi:WD40 repeat protein